MDFQAYNKILICDDQIENLTVNSQIIAYEFKIKYPSYRGVYLSCIEDMRFKVDGQAVDAKNVYLLLNGKQFLLNELKDLYKEYWFILDKATVRIMQDGGISAGQHSVNVFMRHKVPYTGYFGQYLVLDSDETKTLSTETL